MLRSRPASKLYPIYSCVRVLGCVYAAFDRGFLKHNVLHCHGSPVRCMLPLHYFIVILDPVLFVCEGKCNCIVASFWPLPYHLQVVSELVFYGSFRFWGGRRVFMTGGVSQVCQRSCWGR